MSSHALPTTLGALKAHPLGERSRVLRSVKDELRENLIARIRAGGTLFDGVIGYEDTVMPQIVNALLARHNFILLGLRGQAKSRILRALVTLLDEKMPIVAGSEINDNPYAPISKYARQRLDEMGDETPIAWVERGNRYVEKLATPDVTIADIIGDVDPIKAARGGHILSDELTIHYGMLPRANRGLFALNELPDLAGKVQVGLFNIMQEGDVQIKGYPVRLPLDVLLCFTANPEDYTARGKIITPLKDRIGSEVITHYPETVALGMQITAQEAWTQRDSLPVRIPEFVAEVIERIAFEARTDKRIDRRSGVSQRMPISVMESVVSNAERRTLRLGGTEIVPRISDLYAALPAITGKIELEYEGELVGAANIARELIRRASDAVFRDRAGGVNVDDIILWFEDGAALQVTDDVDAGTLARAFDVVPGLVALVHRVGLAPAKDDGFTSAACELVLESLVARRKISRSDAGHYGRAPQERRPRGGQQEFGGGLSA
ncbi:MAG: magnesium chelatase [Gemmatimonadetes bacterium]|nr:magnesium chelatase [Gemmatimonadota bacterium]MCC7324237.1 magnesium chelatase [Gemmatimonadaceae bacterium]MBK6458474.1 magnesium chelatase [Gemmatimonadota bacterium]MBK6843481.1 magnesium chelatase [Gemmatimonadota bacterium]MBK7833425.1 magnesium chelatase [Gemmatimonadota bacterium]